MMTPIMLMNDQIAEVSSMLNHSESTIAYDMKSRNLIPEIDVNISIIMTKRTELTTLLDKMQNKETPYSLELKKLRDSLGSIGDTVKNETKGLTATEEDMRKYKDLEKISIERYDRLLRKNDDLITQLNKCQEMLDAYNLLDDYESFGEIGEKENEKQNQIIEGATGEFNKLSSD
jgi:hypothetical protein